MNETKRYPALAKDDDGLLDEIHATLTSRVEGDSYSNDGSFARELASLPQGLRAMAATHWLDVSLTTDSLTWHFGNFGEPALVALTAEGLRELGLIELAAVFHEASTLMAPFVDKMSPENPPDEVLEKAGLAERGRELDDKASELNELGPDESAIYAAWNRYARTYPERVFTS